MSADEKAFKEAMNKLMKDDVPGKLWTAFLDATEKEGGDPSKFTDQDKRMFMAGLYAMATMGDEALSKNAMTAYAMATKAVYLQFHRPPLDKVHDELVKVTLERR